MNFDRRSSAYDTGIAPVDTTAVTIERRPVAFSWTGEQVMDAYESGAFLELRASDTDGQWHEKNVRVTRIESIEGKTLLDVVTENGNRALIRCDGGGTGGGEIEFAEEGGLQVDASSTGLAAEYQHELGDFRTFIGSHNEKMFSRFVESVTRIIQEHPDATVEEFGAALDPAPVPLEPPISAEEQKQIFAEIRELMLPISHSGHGLGKANASVNPEETLSFHFRGTGEYSGEKRADDKLRRLYINPPLRGITRFIDTFYALLDAKDVPIFQSKLNLEAGRTDATHAYIAQAHNTLTIYCLGDQDVYKVIEAIAQAEDQSGIPLHSYAGEPVVKSPRILDDKVIIGGPDYRSSGAFNPNGMAESHEAWSSTVAYRAYELQQRNHSLTIEEARIVMTRELARMTSKTPGEYLSL